jgi:folate-binding protein YgfZ
MPDLAITSLDDLTVLAARGPDAASFLQGQISQDIELLAERGALLAGLHNPQGRCLALLRLFHLGSDQILLVLPAELALGVRMQLTRYVLRAKVKIEDVSSSWRVYGLTGPDAEAAAATRLHLALDPQGFRQLIVAPRGEPLPQGHVASRATWRIEDIEAGMPEVLGVTAGEFVAQMLNLDALDAISFDKGCYTGQEIIARAHYRGQVKRRMQLFHTENVVPLLPGERIALSDGRSARVVMAEAIEEGGQEFLAVTSLPGLTSVEEAATALAPAGATASIQAMQMPLPYPLPPRPDTASSA